MAASPEPWLALQLGVLAPGASPALVEEYTRRAAIAATYREAAGITNPDQAVSPDPHRGNPELEAMRKAVFTALEIRDEAEILRGLDRGELEARALQGERARAAAPPDVSSQLRRTAQAEADALQRSADAHAQHDHTGAANATTLAAQLAAERQRLEADNARYEQWSADTHATRDTAGKAAAELRRRGHAQREKEPQARPGDEPQATTGWWHQFEADLQAVERAIARQHQAAIDAGEPWPPQRAAEPDPGLTLETSPQDQAAPAQPEQDDRAARLDELLARADQAAQRIAAQQAERHASSEYAARIDLEAQAQSEAGQQAQARDEVELELLRRSSSVLPDEPVDQVIHQRYRLRLAPARIGQDPARQVRHREREEQAIKVRLNSGQAHSAHGTDNAGQPPQVMVAADGICRTFGTGHTAVHALRGVSFTADRGQLVALRGRSGSGKTTLLNIIGGLDDPTAGRVLVDGREVNRMSEQERLALRRDRIAFQAFGLVPMLSAAENIGIPLRIAGCRGGRRGRREQPVSPGAEATATPLTPRTARHSVPWYGP